MFLFANFVEALAGALSMVLTIYMWIVIIRCFISWVNPDPYNPIVRFLYTATDPVFHRLRRAMPFLYTSGLDLSPIVIVVGIYFLQSFLVQSLYDLARTIRYAS
jgi:YggT family protein